MLQLRGCFVKACADLKPDKFLVVYSGKDLFNILEDVGAISLPDLMHEILNK